MPRGLASSKTPVTKDYTEFLGAGAAGQHGDFAAARTTPPIKSFNPRTLLGPLARNLPAMNKKVEAKDGQKAGRGVVASVETTAKPGLLVSRLVARVFTNRYVLFCNRRALERMVKKFVEANS